MPLAGTLREMVHVPGRLFSVNPLTARSVPELFARNERVACLFDTEHGPMALVLVGAMIVASIETVWAGLVTPHKRQVRSVRYDAAARAPIHLDKGAEMGRFAGLHRHRAVRPQALALAGPALGTRAGTDGRNPGIARQHRHFISRKRINIS